MLPGSSASGKGGIQWVPELAKDPLLLRHSTFQQFHKKATRINTHTACLLHP